MIFLKVITDEAIMGSMNITLESIRRQDDKFFKELTAAIGNIRKSGDFSTKSIKKSHVMAVIKEHTGVNIRFNIITGYMARIYLPELTPQHVFDRHISGIYDDKYNIRDVGFKGYVDPEKGMVGGGFSDVECQMYVGTTLFAPNMLTDEQIAAICLHEIGHVFTYYQFISTLAYGALVISKTVESIFSEDSYDKKRIHLKTADEILGIDGKYVEDKILNTDKDNLEVYLVTKYYQSLGTRSTSAYYDMRNCEQLADTFAVKYGAASDLAKANHMLDKQYGSYGKRNAAVHILAETSKLISILVSTKKRKMMRSVLLSLRQPKLYDDPKDRIMYIKFQLIDDLKQVPKSDKQTRTSILEDIDEVDDILKDITYRRDVLTFVHDTFTLHGRSVKQQERQQKKLESMLFNDLFVHAAKLKSIQ